MKLARELVRIEGEVHQVRDEISECEYASRREAYDHKARMSTIQADLTKHTSKLSSLLRDQECLESDLARVVHRLVEG